MPLVWGDVCRALGAEAMDVTFSLPLPYNIQFPAKEYVSSRVMQAKAVGFRNVGYLEVTLDVNHAFALSSFRDGLTTPLEVVAKFS